MSNSKSETPAQPSKDSDDVPRELELTVYEYSFTRQWLKFIDEVNKKPRKAIAGPDQKSEEAQESTGPQQTEGTANTKEDQEEADPRSVNGEGNDRKLYKKEIWDVRPDLASSKSLLVCAKWIPNENNASPIFSLNTHPNITGLLKTTPKDSFAPNITTTLPPRPKPTLSTLSRITHLELTSPKSLTTNVRPLLAALPNLKRLIFHGLPPIHRYYLNTHDLMDYE
jgi:hypothetical protein